MAISRIEVTPLRTVEGNNTRAMANVIVGSPLAIGPFGIVEGELGLFIGHPQRKDREGKWPAGTWFR